METETSKKTSFERLAVVVLVVIFGFTLRGALKGLGLGKRPGSMTQPAPSSSVGSRPVADVTEPSSRPSAKPPVIAEPAMQPVAGAHPGSLNSVSEGFQVAEYLAENLRDPLVSPFSTPPPVRVEAPVPARSETELAAGIPDLEIQGMIWGGRRPQAVINGHVFEVGDTVQGARIVAIDRSGVTIDVQGTLFQMVPHPDETQLADRHEGPYGPRRDRPHYRFNQDRLFE